MSIDHVQSTPIPKLQIHLSGAVLMIAGDDQAAALAGELGGQVERPLLADGFDHSIAALAGSQLSDALHNLAMVLHGNSLTRAERAGQVQGKGPARNG